jgi:hypothetical protein
VENENLVFNLNQNEFLINVFNKSNYGIYVKINYISVYDERFEINALWKSSEDRGNETRTEDIKLRGQYFKKAILYQAILEFLHNKDITDKRNQKLNQLGI